MGEGAFLTFHEDLFGEAADPSPTVALPDLNGYLFVRNCAIGMADRLGLVEIDTGVERVEAPMRIRLEAHYFLRLSDGTSCGFWPKGARRSCCRCYHSCG